MSNLSLPEPPQTLKPKWYMTLLRLPQNYAESSEVVQSAIPVGKPGKQVYFRVHPEWQLYVATLEHEKCLYLVQANLYDALEADLCHKLIAPYITRDGDVGLWPLSPLQTTGKANEWIASAHRALAAARKGWIRMRSNMRLQSYDLIRPKAAWEEPTWPEQNFEELLETAFADKVLSTLDHPVLLALHGEA